MRELFFWQTLGDFLKLIGTLFGILMAAKAEHFKAILIKYSLFECICICGSYDVSIR